MTYNDDACEQTILRFKKDTCLSVVDHNAIISQGCLYDGQVCVLNWQKVAISDKNKRRLTNDTNDYFNKFLERTRADKTIILIVDESHHAQHTENSQYVVGKINPVMTYNVSATHGGKIGNIGYPYSIVVDEQDVINSGALKRNIESQTVEDIIGNNDFDEDDIDLLYIKLADNKRRELNETYKKATNAPINPLVIILLPNDEKNTESNEKINSYRRYLIDKLDIKPDEICMYMDGNKSNYDESVKNNDSKIKFIFSKTAVSMGWDCPRADILVLYRNVKKASTNIQILGRIRRTAEGRHYKDFDLLNRCYVYTNHDRKSLYSATDIIHNDSLSIKNEIGQLSITSQFYRPSNQLIMNELSDLDYGKFKEFMSHELNSSFNIIKGDSKRNIRAIKSAGMMVMDVNRPEYIVPTNVNESTGLKFVKSYNTSNDGTAILINDKQAEEIVFDFLKKTVCDYNAGSVNSYSTNKESSPIRNIYDFILDWYNDPETLGIESAYASNIIYNNVINADNNPLALPILNALESFEKYKNLPDGSGKRTGDFFAPAPKIIGD